MQLYKVLLPLNFDEPLDYLGEEEFKTGELVKVPFRSGTKIGVVWGKGEAEVEASRSAV